MHKFLIPLIACLLCTSTLLRAQVPTVISVPYPFSPSSAPTGPDAAACNFAGTFTPGQFIGQSNDTGLDTIFLCKGDSLFLQGNGDADLTGDPNAATQPGVAYIFYSCTPTIDGMTLQTILANDPCLLLAPNNLPYFAFGQPNGSIWLFNSGNLQTLFNGGQPVLLHFAPATVDDFSSSQPYEPTSPGFPPGPCVNVNTAVQFEVVYLNAIAESGVSANFGNDCLGKFRVSGGYPQWNTSAKYTIDISLQGNPSVKALIYNAADQLKNNADVIFSVPQPGIYDVTIEDGKSCGHTFQIAMNACNATDNAVLTLPDTISPPGSTICIPVNVNGFQIVGASFSLDWDPTILQYSGVQNPNPAIGTFNAGNLNTQNILNGQLGVIIYDQDTIGSTIVVPNGQQLFEVCFLVLGPMDSCSVLTATNSPSQINIEDPIGNSLALTVNTGQVCVGFLPFKVDIAVTDTTCNGTASIEVTASGGMEGYEVVISKLVTGPNSLGNITNSGGTYVRTNLGSGMYSICVTDFNGVGTNVFCDTITLDIPTLGASLQNTQLPTCNGAMDGIVTAIVSVSGTAVPNPGPNFTFTWTPAPSPTGPEYFNATAGNYAVTITDTNTGCTATASGALDQPSLITGQSVVTAASCPGVFDGAITYTPQGGTPFANNFYQYNWEYTPSPSLPPSQGPAGQGNPITIIDLAAGSWFLTVTDANGCTRTDEITVGNLKNVEVMLASLDNTKCAGDSTGAICAEVQETPASANPNYTFFWSPLGFPQTSTPLTSCYTNLPAGSYFVLAIDAMGCADTATYEVLSPAPFVLDTLSLQNPGCTFQSNGSIKVQGFGGTGGPNFTYNWSNMVTGNMIMNLFPGDYSVTATDANGCVDSLNFTLQLPLPPAITAIDSTSVKCGSDGCLTVTAPTAVVFNWQTIAGQAVGTTAQVCNLPGGTYVISITDSQGCSTTDTISLAGVIPMSFSDTTLLNPSCFGYDDGTIGVGVMDGNPNYSYLWSDPTGQATSILTQVPAGPYTVTVTDAQGCTLLGTFTLTDPPQIKTFFSEADSTSCFGVCDGGITVIAQYATVPPTFGDFNFVWDDAGTDSVRTNLCADTISVITIDGNNCFAIDTVIIPGPPAVAYDTLYTIDASCFGSADGQAFVDGAGGNGGPYTYSWQGGSSTGLSAGNYNVTVSDQKGCTGVFVAEVMEPSAVQVLVDDQLSSDVICAGEESGIAAVTVSGGNPGGYHYMWEDANGMSLGIDLPIAENLAAGTYSVTVTDPKGCTGVQLLPVYEPPVVQGAYIPWEELLCFGDETTLYIDTITGGSGGPYQFSLDFGVTLNPDFAVSMGGGEHYITYLDRLGCENTDTITVNEPEPIVVTFDPIEIEIELGDSIQLNPLITGAVVDTFIWTPTAGLQNPTSITPTVYTFNNQAFTLTVFDANGCSGTGSVQINIDPNRNVYVPNVFFPGNPKGINDHFNPQIGRGVEHVNYMRVYDRWGTLMYERNDFLPNNDNLAEGWDGKSRGDYVNPGVFVYVIEVVFLDGRVLLYRGDVTVIR
ncbi:MAG: gliding motility-associated C-terminal domain-containing protein [Saprospiraceae bacterium]|nr:gliding motility-associated C-terminal domain-containing protein [Saprospiraceae bacterium]